MQRTDIEGFGLSIDLESSEPFFFKSRMGATFHVTGTFRPEDLTAASGISPSSIARRGDKKRLVVGTYDYDLWEFESPLSEGYELEFHIRYLLDKLAERWTMWAQIAKDTDHYQLSMSTVMYLNPSSIPGCYFPEDLIRRLAEINCSLDIDLYISSNNEQSNGLV